MKSSFEKHSRLKWNRAFHRLKHLNEVNCYYNNLTLTSQEEPEGLVGSSFH